MHLDLQLLLHVTLYSSAALLACLVLRRALRAWLGATAAYAIWVAVPLAVLAAVMPGPPIASALPTMPALVAMPLNLHASEPVWAAGLLTAWLAGAAAMAVALCWRQWRFVCSLGALRAVDAGVWTAMHDVGLPVSLGIWRPRIVLPMDFDTRYSAAERTLILAHERLHLRRGDLHANLLAALLLCIGWWNLDASGMARVPAGSGTGLRCSGADALPGQAPQLRYRDAQDPRWCRLDADGLPLECAARAHPTRGCLAEACGRGAPCAMEPAHGSGTGGDGQWRLLGVPTRTTAGYARARQRAGFPHHAAAQVSA